VTDVSGPDNDQMAEGVGMNWASEINNINWLTWNFGHTVL